MTDRAQLTDTQRAVLALLIDGAEVGVDVRRSSGGAFISVPTDRGYCLARTLRYDTLERLRSLGFLVRVFDYPVTPYEITPQGRHVGVECKRLNDESFITQTTEAQTNER